MTREQNQGASWLITKAAFLLLAIELALAVVLIGYAWIHKSTLAGY